ncbi:nitroreductase family protein [Clostridium sp. JS66]|uniref:nitroreductase family protein n=1 Tax=Clostridium sp. JS66 TaxID=3064705 RepID=UPI00298DDB0E|nr:nitroreductase family protein [Clostridium sp. JS66]WPC39934.1 nitroreductase family protein [Clostridium sp. JS66]
MSLITLNKEKCIKCGACVMECPISILRMGENGPEEIYEDRCMSCGHCVAVCPKEAIDNKKSPLSMQVDAKNLTRLNAEEAENFIRSRRSIRSFKETKVPREKLIKLTDIAHFAPTASNLQGISYMIIDDKEVIKLAAEASMNWLQNHPLYKRAFFGMIKTYKETGINNILRNAPSIILAMSNKRFRLGRENTILSLSYLELFAPSLGLGSCWAGVFERCALDESSPIPEIFKVPEGKKITGIVMVGYPRYKFNRLTDRNPLDVAFYEK